MTYRKQYHLEKNLKSTKSEYANGILTDYRQSCDEGLDVKKYEALFHAVAALTEDETQKSALADTLFEMIADAPMREDYPFREPSSWEEIRALCKPYSVKNPKMPNEESLREKISGAWYGRICGCILGKPAEGTRFAELQKFLKDAGNYPMRRYIQRADIHYKSTIRTSCLADEMSFAPWDDDTNYVALAQVLIEKYGRDFTSKDVLDIWLEKQPISSYFTAEKTALLNYINGIQPPVSAVFQNPYREWIGAQIRGDYFGYINVGNPEAAAEMAFRDASVSHVKNGIYGEMFVAAMLAVAAVTNDMEEIIRTGLSWIPSTSRLYAAVEHLLSDYQKGVSREEAFNAIHSAWDDRDGYDWCHTISNALIVTAALLYGENDFGKSICMAVETGFDTDCNGATVGSVLGMILGEKGISPEWKEPVHGVLETTVQGVGKRPVSDFIDRTMKHILENSEPVK